MKENITKSKVKEQSSACLHMVSVLAFYSKVTEGEITANTMMSNGWVGFVFRGSCFEMENEEWRPSTG